MYIHSLAKTEFNSLHLSSSIRNLNICYCIRTTEEIILRNLFCMMSFWVLNFHFLNVFFVCSLVASSKSPRLNGGCKPQGRLQSFSSKAFLSCLAK